MNSIFPVLLQNVTVGLFSDVVVDVVADVGLFGVGSLKHDFLQSSHVLCTTAHRQGNLPGNSRRRESHIPRTRCTFVLRPRTHDPGHVSPPSVRHFRPHLIVYLCHIAVVVAIGHIAIEHRNVKILPWT